MIESADMLGVERRLCSDLGRVRLAQSYLLIRLIRVNNDRRHCRDQATTSIASRVLSLVSQVLEIGTLEESGKVRVDNPLGGAFTKRMKE